MFLESALVLGVTIMLVLGHHRSLSGVHANPVHEREGQSGGAMGGRELEPKH